MNQQQPPQQQYNVRIERKLSPAQNTLLTIMMVLGVLMIATVCCLIAAMIISGLLGLGLFGALFSAILSQ